MHDFTIPIGPQHPSIKEPLCLRISLEGNYIQEANIRLGYIHRGIEKLTEDKPIDKAAAIVEKICGICSNAHLSCFIIAIENILDYTAPDRVRYIRSLIGELERIHSHLLWSGFMMHEIGFDTMFAYFLREREHVLDIFEKITGGRVFHSLSKIKTLRHDLTEDDVRFVIKKMDLLEKKISEYTKIIEKDGVIRARLAETGFISKEQAKRFCLVGPTARASGIKMDTRKKDGYEGYRDVDFDIIVGDKGDAHERTLVRLREVLESIKIIRQLMKNLPDEKIPEYSRVYVEKGVGVGRVEAPRGENFYFVKVNENKVERIKIRTPTFANISIVPVLLKGREVGDTPVILSSIDPCFSCLERVIVVKDGKQEVLNENGFRSKYV